MRRPPGTLAVYQLAGRWIGGSWHLLPRLVGARGLFTCRVQETTDQRATAAWLTQHCVLQSQRSTQIALSQQH